MKGRGSHTRAAAPPRGMPRWIATVVALVSVLAAACTPAAVPPAAAPTAPAAPAAKPTEPPKPTAPAATTAPAVATTAPAAKPPSTIAPAPAAAAAAAPAAKAITLPPPEVKSITIAHSTLEPTQLALAMAQELQLYRKYGLEKLEIVFSEGDAKTVQSIMSGGADVAAMGVGNVITSQTTDVPLLTVTLTATKLTDSIVAAPNVKTPADLKGKTLAIGAFGGTAHGAALIGLKSIGLTDQDLTLTPLGSQATRFAALKGGSVAAAMSDVALDEENMAQGFNILARLPDTPQEFARNGLNLRRDWYEKNPNTTLALVATVLDGQNMIWTDTEKAIDVFQKWGQVKERATAEKQVREFVKYGRRDMRWSKEAFEIARDVFATANPAMKDVDVTKAYTFVPLDRLRDLGLNQQLNIPAGR